MNIDYRPPSELVELNRGIMSATVWESSLLLRKIETWYGIVSALHRTTIMQARTACRRSAKVSSKLHFQVAAIMKHYVDHDNLSNRDREYLKEAINQAEEVETYAQEMIAEIRGNRLGNVKYVPSIKEVKKQAPA